MKKVMMLILLCALIYGVYQLYDTADYHVIKLLQSDGVTDQIRGAVRAGKKGDKKFVPYLLANVGDSTASTNLFYQGFSVYEEKIWALEKIYKKSAPHRVKQFDDPDSVNIKFFMALYEHDKAAN